MQEAWNARGRRTTETRTAPSLLPRLWGNGQGATPAVAFAERDVRKKTPPGRPLYDPRHEVEDGLALFLENEAIDCRRHRHCRKASHMTCLGRQSRSDDPWTTGGAAGPCNACKYGCKSDGYPREGQRFPCRIPSLAKDEVVVSMVGETSWSKSHIEEAIS